MPPRGSRPNSQRPPARRTGLARPARHRKPEGGLSRLQAPGPTSSRAAAAGVRPPLHLLRPTQEAANLGSLAPALRRACARAVSLLCHRPAATGHLANATPVAGLAGPGALREGGDRSDTKFRMSSGQTGLLRTASSLMTSRQVAGHSDVTAGRLHVVPAASQQRPHRIAVGPLPLSASS